MTDTGLVAAAYLVFLALLLVYFAIMALKLARIGRDVEAVASAIEGRPTPLEEPPVSEPVVQ